MKKTVLFFILIFGLSIFGYGQNTSASTSKDKTTKTKTSTTSKSGKKAPSSAPANRSADDATKNNEQAKKEIPQGQPGVVFKFDTEFIDLGKVKKGEKRSFKYNFINAGTETMEFDIVSGCDCTKTDWPRNPIKPGQKGVIDVTFDSTEKEKSETVDVDIYLDNKDPKTGRSIFKRVKYKFELVN